MQALADQQADARLKTHLRARIRCPSIAEMHSVFEAFDAQQVMAGGYWFMGCQLLHVLGTVVVCPIASLRLQLDIQIGAQLQAGCLSLREFVAALASLGVVLSPKEVDWVSRVAPARDGAVPYGELCNAFEDA